jgi:MFS family permease
VSYWIRKNILETPEFLVNIRNRAQSAQYGFLYPLKVLLKENAASVLIGFGLAFFLATLAIVLLYFPVYINTYFAYELPQIYRAMIIGLVASFCSMLFFGWLSDYFSKVKILLFVLLGFGFSLGLLYQLLNSHYLYSLQIFFIIYNMWLAAFYTSFLSILPRLFSTDSRCTGTTLVYNSAFSLASLIPTAHTYFFRIYPSVLLLGIFFILSIVIALLSITIFTLSGRSQKML